MKYKQYRMHTGFCSTLMFLMTSMCSLQSSAKDELAEDSKSLGPSSVTSELEKVQEIRKEATWPTMPNFTEYNLKLAADYQLLYQQLSSSLSDTKGFGGVARLYGTWQPTNTGHLVFKAEHRHSIGDYIAPKSQQLSAGIVGVSGPTFSDAKAVLTNLYWGQSFENNKMAYIAGIIDVSDYIDVYGLANVWVDFNNLAFSTNPTIPVPAQGIGAAGRWASTNNFYVLGSVADANGDPHRQEKSFDSFFGTSEYFSHLEFGQVGSWEDRWAQNMHITIWHVDGKKVDGTPSDWGVAASWNQRFGKWLPFIRAGYADKGVGLQKKMLAAGAGYTINDNGDYVGVGLSWGETAANSNDQFILENYFKWQALPRLLVVPSIQWIVNPSNNVEKDQIWQGSIKIRATF